MIRLIRSTMGASLVEYGILVGLIAVLAIGAVMALGAQTQTVFKSSAANLGWYMDGVGNDYPARYRFVARRSGSDNNVIGFDRDNLSSDQYGDMAEEEFNDLVLRSVQYDESTGNLSAATVGNTTSLTAGHHMICISLMTGDIEMSMDFDAYPGSYVGMAASTFYEKPMSSSPFVEGQELACIVEMK